MTSEIRNKKFSAYLYEFLQDKEARTEYLNAALENFGEDHDKELFLAAIKNVINAGGGMSEVSKKTGLGRQHLYRMLSAEGNPTLDSIWLLLNSIGLRLAVQPISEIAKNY